MSERKVQIVTLKYGAAFFHANELNTYPDVLNVFAPGSKLGRRIYGLVIHEPQASSIHITLGEARNLIEQLQGAIDFYEAGEAGSE